MTRDRETRRITVLVFYGTVFLLAWLAYRIVEPFLIQIGWAVVLAICLSPIQDRLHPRLGPTRTAVLLVLLVLVVLVLPLAFAGTALVTQGEGAVSNLQAQLQDRGGASAWLHEAWNWVRAKVPMLPTEEEAIAKVTGSVGGLAGFMAARAGGLLKGAAAFVFNLVITMGVLFFLLRDSVSFASGFRRLLPFGQEQNERLVTLARDLVSASVTATLAISLIQGLVGGITFALLGIGGAAVWGLMMGILSFVPLVGATLVWLPTAGWLILSGSPVKGTLLLLVGVLILGNVDNVVRPLLLSGKARMNTLVLLVSLLGGVGAFGFIGIVLGPLVAAVVTALFESYVQPAAKEVVLSHLSVVHDIYAAFGRGDVPAILSHLAQSVEWEYGAGESNVPWLQKRHGHQGAAQFFSELGATLEIVKFVPKLFFEGPGIVVVLLDLEARVKATGKTIHEEDEVHIWHLNEAGQVTRFRHRVDTLQHAAAC